MKGGEKVNSVDEERPTFSFFFGSGGESLLSRGLTWLLRRGTLARQVEGFARRRFIQSLGALPRC